MEMFSSGDSIQVKCTRLMKKGKERLEKDEESPKKTLKLGLPRRQGVLGKRRYEEVKLTRSGGKVWKRYWQSVKNKTGRGIKGRGSY